MKMKHAHWATDDEIESGIKYKIINGVSYTLKVGVKRCYNGEYESKLKWYIINGKELRRQNGRS
jgi:hypothetical protein